MSSVVCRDDPELDKLMKERLRWGDPMAHLVKVSSNKVIGYLVVKSTDF